MLKLIND